VKQPTEDWLESVEATLPFARSSLMLLNMKKGPVVVATEAQDH
jgi:hypothetical protein